MCLTFKSQFLNPKNMKLNNDWQAVSQAQDYTLYCKYKRKRTKLMNDVRDWNTNMCAKHKQLCQKLWHSKLGRQMHIQQHNVMHAGLS